MTAAEFYVCVYNIYLTRIRARYRDKTSNKWMQMCIRDRVVHTVAIIIMYEHERNNN